MQATVVSEKVVKINLDRKGGKTILTVKVAPEIEALFRGCVKGQPMNVSVGSKKMNWYPVTDYSQKFRRWAGRYHLNAPQRGLDMDGLYNYSYIFCEGTSGKDGVSVEFTGDLYSREQLVQYVQEFEEMVREIYSEFISDLSIESSMTVKTLRV
jgi:hypothetical protein